MNVERLVAMVNDIAAFFAGEAGPGAPAAVANHLRRFWEPRMRSQIVEAYRNDPSSLRNVSDTGRAAIAELAADEGPSRSNHENTKVSKVTTEE